MKVLFLLVQPFDPNAGGVQMSTFKLSTYFNEAGMSVSVFSFSLTDHNVPDFVEFSHATVKGLQFNENNINDCVEFAKKVEPDVIINQMPYDIKGNLIIRLKEELKCLILGCLRGSFFAVKNNLETYRTTLLPKPAQPFFKNKLGYWLLLQVHKLKHSRDLKLTLDTHDYYVLFGDPNRVELEYFLGNYKQNKLAYIPNSIPNVKEIMPKKEKRILWLSRVDYRQKHADLIIPLWKLIKDRLPDWEFDLVGGGGALEAVRKQAEEENLERFHIYGKQKPDDYYARSPIYVMTSSFEGFPNTLIESQSYGCVPVVFDSYPMIQEIIAKENAVFIETFNILAMADEIVRLAQNQELCNQMGIEALENARRFTIDKVGGKWRQLFEDYMNKY